MNTEGVVGESELILDEFESLQLPAGVIPRGGAIARDGTVLLWSDTQLWTVDPILGRLDPICVNQHLAPRQATFVRNAYGVALFDSLSSNVVEVTNKRHCDIRIIGNAEGAEVVVPWKSRWREIRYHPRGQLDIRESVNPGAEWSQLRFPPRFPARFGVPTDYSWSTDVDGQVLLAEAEFPFRTFRTNDDKGVELLIDPLQRAAAGERARLIDGWKSLRVMALDAGYLQVLADPRSDQRRFVLADSKGRVIRVTPLDVAIGMLDVNRERRLIVALRNIGVRELVYYRWPWRTSGQLSTGDE